MRPLSIAVIASASAIALTQIASAADLPARRLLHTTAASTGDYLDRLLYRSPCGRRMGRQDDIRSVAIAGCVRYGSCRRLSRWR